LGESDDSAWVLVGRISYARLDEMIVAVETYLKHQFGGIEVIKEEAGVMFKIREVPVVRVVVERSEDKFASTLTDIHVNNRLEDWQKNSIINFIQVLVVRLGWG